MKLLELRKSWNQIVFKLTPSGEGLRPRSMLIFRSYARILQILAIFVLGQSIQIFALPSIGPLLVDGGIGTPLWSDTKF